MKCDRMAIAIGRMTRRIGCANRRATIKERQMINHKLYLFVLTAMLICPLNATAQDSSVSDEMLISVRETPAFFEHSSDGIRALKDRKPEDKNGFWVSGVEGALDGVYHARFIPGKRPDFSFLFRADFPKDLAEVNGYSVTMDGSHFQIHRWEEGYAQPVTDRVKISKMPKQVDMTVKMKGSHFEVTIQDEKQKEIVKLSFDDAKFRGTSSGWRVYKKQDANTSMVSMDFKADSEQTALESMLDSTDPDAYTRQHPKVFVVVPQDDKTSDKRALLKKCVKLNNSIIENHDIYRCKHEVMMSIVDEKRHLPDGWYWSEPRNSFLDGEYRQAAQDLKCKIPMRCDKSQPLDPNRSAKDVAMIQAYLDNYAEVCKKNVKNVRIETIGKSWMGHDIRAIVLSDLPDDKPKPRLLINASHHGIELLAADFAFDVLEYICEKTKPSDYIHYNTLHKMELWVIPTVNLDGVDVFFHVSDHLGRKNGHGVFNHVNDKPWPAKIGPQKSYEGYYRYRPNYIDVGAGVDINRNYPLHFGATGELSSSTRRRDYWYRGAYAASEPEIQSMMNLFHTEQFAGSISFHTVSTRILSPYSIDALQNPPHDKDPAWQLALKMAEAAGIQANGKNYEVVKNLYSVDGTDQDWFRMVSGTMAYLIEGALHNPTGEKRRDAVERNRPAWLTFLDQMTRVNVIRVQDTNGNPLIAEVSYSDVPALNGEHWFTRCQDGTHTMYCTGKRDVTVTLYDGSTQTKTVKCPGGINEVAFTFERPADYSIEKAWCSTGLCENDNMMSVDTLCHIKNNTCPSLPAQQYCYIQDTCVPDGFVIPLGFFGAIKCDARENNRWWQVADDK